MAVSFTGFDLRVTQIADKIVTAVKADSYRTVAANWCGVEVDIFARWLQRGGDGDEPYATLRRRIEEAEAEVELRLVSAVTKAGGKDVKAALSYLERKFPERWGRSVAPAAGVTLDLGSMLAKVDERIRAFRDPRAARAALAAGQVIDVERRAVPHDPRPPRVSVRGDDETFDDERDVEQVD